MDGLSEEIVKSPSDANKVMSTGYKNRHVSSTAMNRDSSRSHTVFLLSMTASSQNENGLKKSPVERHSVWWISRVVKDRNRRKLKVLV